MAVVEIAHMWMAVLHRFMLVFMGMPSRRSTGMLMLVMGIGILRTVLMAVVVMHRRVVMPVAVVITDQQDHATGHQCCCENQGAAHGTAQHHHGKHSSNKRRRGEQHSFPCRSKLPQRDQIQPDRDAVAQCANHQQREAASHWREGLLKHD